MATLLVVFFSSLLTALIITPFVTRLALRYRLVDAPSDRKVHRKPIPRLGGIALYLALFIPVAALLIYSHENMNQFIRRPALLYITGGATVVFLMGLADDIWRLRPGIKFLVQTLAALMACAGGVCISQIQLPWSPAIAMGWLSIPVTLFWFLLVINAINLIDGLDGLAAGVSLFASLVLLVLCERSGNTPVAMGLAGLAGACLGFLRYNFNPASIFMGDSGSYLLGYMLASLSILGSMKSEATVAILIPIIALGLPLIDTILAPIRRFLLGKELFQPDKSHIHHKLLKLGFSQRNAVLLLYGSMIFLGCFALLIVNQRNEKAALPLLILGVTILIAIRKLGYLEYLAVDKVIGYLQDVTDVIGIHRDRRTFLQHQIAIMESVDCDELWNRVIEALQFLRVDQAEIQLNGVRFDSSCDGHYTWCGREIPTDPKECRHSLMSMDLPLAHDCENFGVLHLKKDLRHDPMSHYTLRRIEHLRRSIVQKMKDLNEEAKAVQTRPEIVRHSIKGVEES